MEIIPYVAQAPSLYQTERTKRAKLITKIALVVLTLDFGLFSWYIATWNAEKKQECVFLHSMHNCKGSGFFLAEICQHIELCLLLTRPSVVFFIIQYAGACILVFEEAFSHFNYPILVLVIPILVYAVHQRRKKTN